MVKMWVSFAISGALCGLVVNTMYQQLGWLGFLLALPVCFLIGYGMATLVTD